MTPEEHALLFRTHYANTDLEIASAREPAALKAVFRKRRFFQMWEHCLEDGSWVGRFETSRQYNKPNANIVGFLRVIESLEGRALREWRACLRRKFDIGYTAGLEPFHFAQALSNKLVSRIAKAGASLHVTVYAVAKESNPSAFK